MGRKSKSYARQRSRRSILRYARLHRRRPNLSEEKIPNETHLQENQEEIMETECDANVGVEEIPNFEDVRDVPAFECFREDDPNNINGFRFIEYLYFWNQLLLLEAHNKTMDCRLSNLVYTSEHREGLISKFYYQCNMCNKILSIQCCSNTNYNINIASVIGVMNAGCGYSQLNQFMSSVNVPPMNKSTYLRTQNIASEAWETTAKKAMKEAGEEEKRLAIEAGSIDKDGIPIIRVVCDGSWAKRSYKSNYSSLSGVAAIIGYQTQKVLHIGIKNKYCIICKRADNKGLQPRTHTCFQNWNGSASAMEAAIISEGFANSIEKHGLIYGEMIGDGDCNTFKKIQDLKPYKSLSVEKIECKNHLLRNYTNKLRDLCKDTTAGEPIVRKLVQNKILRLRTAVDKAVQYRKDENCLNDVKIQRLKQDILNSPSHVFGEHKNCKSAGYFCTKDKTVEDNFIPDLMKNPIYDRMMRIVRLLSLNSKSLISDVNSNSVEQLYSLIAKYTGGKRILYCSRRSYRTRCFMSVIARNKKDTLSTVYKYFTENEPGEFVKRLELNQRRNLTYARGKRTKNKRTFPKTNNEYGQFAEKPNISNEEMSHAMSEFLHSLEKTDAERDRLEVMTRENNELWKEERKKLCTASNNGKICKMRPSTSCKSIVYNMLYGEAYSKSLFWGKVHEKDAILSIEINEGVNVQKCGLFTSKRVPFLGATPDGIIDDKIIVEVKCPYSARLMTPEEGIETKKITFWKKLNDQYVINKRHNWYYQIQQQLFVTQKEELLFCCWTTKGYKIQKIQYDKIFFECENLPKLDKFFHNCLVPEIIDPKFIKNLIRDPDYILEAQQKNKNK